MTARSGPRAEGAALALELFRAGVDAVAGDACVRRELELMRREPAGLGSRLRLVAFGKAADAMARGALDVLERSPDTSLVGGLVVTKHDHLTAAVRRDPRLRSLESSHPVPDESSLAAGAALLAEVSRAGSDEHLLVLISGGGSALVEALVPGVDLAELRERTDALLANGAPIGEINRARRSLSRIKGGGLLDHVRAGRVTQLLISDVPGDVVGDIASGPLLRPGSDRVRGPESGRGGGPGGGPGGACAVDTRVVASNAIARHAVVAAAEARGLSAIDAGAILDGDVNDVVARLVAGFEADVRVAGGEPTIVLPPRPGRGGRNQQLAALVARELARGGAVGGTWLVCGTDGTDGPTDAAGGVVDARTCGRAEAAGANVEAALSGADAGPWLETAGALVRTGPTGTNVSDLAIGVRTVSGRAR